MPRRWRGTTWQSARWRSCSRASRRRGRPAPRGPRRRARRWSPPHRRRWRARPGTASRGTRIGADMHQTLPGCGPGPALGGDVGQPRAQRQHQVGLAAKAARWASGFAGRGRRHRAGAGWETGPAGGRRPRPAVPRLRRNASSAARPAADSKPWPASRIGRSAARSSRPSSRHRPARAAAGAAGRRQQRRGAFHREHVLGQREHHRPRHPAHRHGDRRGRCFRHLVGVGDLPDPFRHAAEHVGVMDLLEGIPPEIPLLHLADEQDQRHRILFGGVHRDAGVAGAGATGDQHHPGNPVSFASATAMKPAPPSVRQVTRSSLLCACSASSRAM